MGAFAAGQVVVLPFPFSDLTQSKYRPALLIANASRGDWIACQITSNPYADTRAVRVAEQDFTSGGCVARALRDQESSSPQTKPCSQVLQDNCVRIAWPKCDAQWLKSSRAAPCSRLSLQTGHVLR